MTMNDGSGLIDDEHKLELKTRCRRQVAQCEGSLDSGARPEWSGLRVADGDEANSRDKTVE